MRRRKSEDEPGVAELEVEVDQHDSLARIGERHREVRRHERLARTALGAHDDDHPACASRGPSVARRRRATPFSSAASSSLDTRSRSAGEGGSPSAIGKRHEVLRPSREGAAEEPLAEPA